MLLKANPFISIPRRYVQALFVGQSKAKGSVRALWPIIDHKNRLENRKELEENIKRRNLLDKINIADLCEKWELYKSSETQKETIEKRRKQLFNLITKLNNSESLSAEDQSCLEASQQEARTLRKEYKSACERFYDIQELFNIDFLALPNKLMPNSPDDEQIVYEFGCKPTVDQCQHHLNHEHLISFFNENSYFLQNEAATFDLTFPLKCLDFFRQHDFSQFINVDFVKTIVVEGGAVPLADLYEVVHNFHENNSNLVHLTGGGSWLSFLGYIAKLKIDKASLPLQFVSAGKIYRPTVSRDLGLFDTAQSTGVQIFLATTEQEANDRFQVTIELIKRIYEAIGIHFRVVYVAASQLQAAECFSARFEMYSPCLGRYIEVGHLSHFSDYISYRLRFQCERDETNKQYKPHILGGTVCNVTKLLAIILETFNGQLPNTILNSKLVK